MAQSWFFELEGPYANRWVWRRVNEYGHVLDESRPFPYYLNAIRDAKTHGFSGEPEFRRPPPVIRRRY